MRKKYASEIKFQITCRGFQAEISRRSRQKSTFTGHFFGSFLKTDFFNRIGQKQTLERS